MAWLPVWRLSLLSCRSAWESVCLGTFFSILIDQGSDSMERLSGIVDVVLRRRFGEEGSTDNFLVPYHMISCLIEDRFRR